MTEKAPGTAAGRAIRAGILRLGQVRLLGIAVLLLLIGIKLIAGGLGVGAGGAPH